MDPEGFEVRWSRRQLLQYAALGAGWMALARLGLPSVASAAWRGSYDLQVLSRNDAAVLAAVMERMVRGGDEALPPVKKTHAVETVDWALTFAAPALQSQARWLLRIFNWSPLWVLWKPAFFVNLPDERQDACLEAWAGSSRAWMRTGFLALKNLSVLGYYSQDETWAAIHYRGPWLPRPRRVAWAEQERGNP
ncbi:MAG: hypothetical protein KatS3mg077_1059 [Candidatus Binatia bacterium]|nr:MAG: hypothetical protein KatS3mg077_1059 [Candidatus Binatia bacterium]